MMKFVADSAPDGFRVTGVRAPGSGKIRMKYAEIIDEEAIHSQAVHNGAEMRHENDDSDHIQEPSVVLFRRFSREQTRADSFRRRIGQRPFVLEELLPVLNLQGEKRRRDIVSKNIESFVISNIVINILECRDNQGRIEISEFGVID